MSNTALALVNDENSIDPFRGQRELVKKQLAPGIDDGNLALFGIVCQRTGLDPFLKQIYTIQRGGKWTIQTGIDGYRLLAARTGQLAGIDDAEYDTENEAHPNKARVTVWRFVAGTRVPFSATARWSEYKPEKGGGMWDRMPYLMLGKCAESLALRKAFPAELSGVYTAEEMAQADNDLPPVATVTSAQPQRNTTLTAEQTAELKREIPALCQDLGISKQEKEALWRKHNKNLLDIRNELVRRWNEAQPEVSLAPADDNDITFTVDEIPASLETLPVGTRGM